MRTPNKIEAFNSWVNNLKGAYETLVVTLMGIAIIKKRKKDSIERKKYHYNVLFIKALRRLGILPFCITHDRRIT